MKDSNDYPLEWTLQRMDVVEYQGTRFFITKINGDTANLREITDANNIIPNVPIIDLRKVIDEGPLSEKEKDSIRTTARVNELAAAIQKRIMPNDPEKSN